MIVNSWNSPDICRAVAREIIKEDGIGKNGLLGKGITGTMGRNGFFNMIYFGFYHTTRTWLPSAEDPRLEFCRKVCLGLGSVKLERAQLSGTQRGSLPPQYFSEPPT